jgi:glycosyltransferase involved in cell wall biosynthesis
MSTESAAAELTRPLRISCAGVTPLRVLQVTQAYYPFLDRGGPAVMVHALARGLAKRGHLVTVLTSDLGMGSAKYSSFPAVRDRRGWRSLEDSVEAVFLHPWARYRSVTWNQGVAWFCRERLDSFDVVHIFGIYDLLGPAVARACRRIGIPYVIEPMGMYRPIIRSIPLKRADLRWLGAPMVGGAQRFVATSPQEQQELIEEGIDPEKVVVRRNGIELPESLPSAGTFRRQWNIPDEASLVLFLGRLVSKKSPGLLIEAFAQWQAGSSRGRTSTLVLAGPHEGDGYREKLEREVVRLNLAGRVVFTGPLYDEAKWSAYRDADVFVLPSQNENFGIAVAEAVACGTPVLVTDRCGVAPLVDGRAGVVVPHDREALVAALGQLLDHPALHERLRQGCAEVAREMDWKEPLSETEALYTKLLARKPAI